MADAVVLDVGARAVRVSSPTKPYLPELGVTKLDLVEYVLAVGDGILAALRDRPTTLERWPGGVREGARLSTRSDHSGDAFYQKKLPRGAPEWVRTATVTYPSGRTAEQVCPDELAVVAWAVNLGTLTFHPWPVRREALDHPDQLRVDLDPGPGTSFADAVVVAHELQAVLAELDLVGYPKTSGGRGLHVYVAIQPRWTFVQARRAVIALARELARRMPSQVTTSWWKEERGERIFVDFNQMARDRTMASAYSVRPTPRGLVSMPLRWSEIDDVAPADFDVRTAPVRFAEQGDAAATLGEHPGTLDTLLDWAARDERDRGEADLPYPPEYPKMPGEPMRVQPSRRARGETS